MAVPIYDEVESPNNFLSKKSIFWIVLMIQVTAGSGISNYWSVMDAKLCVTQS